MDKIGNKELYGVGFLSVKEIFIISKLHTHAIIPHGEEAPSSLVSVHPPLHLHQRNVQLLLGTVKAALN